LDEWGRPTWVVESDGESAGGGDETPTRQQTTEPEAEHTLSPLPACPPARPPAGRDGRRVEEIVETWVVQDEWWRTPINRRYVEVVLEGGAHVVLFEDLTTGDWFLQKP